MFVATKLKPRRPVTGKTATSPCNVASICIGHARHPTFITVVYRPPNTSRFDTKRLLNYLSSVANKNCDWILVGDFNLPHINWERPSLTKCDGIHNEFQGAMFEMSLVQCVHVPTRGENIWTLCLLRVQIMWLTVK